jgi:hypothetical protein
MKDDFMLAVQREMELLFFQLFYLFEREIRVWTQ